MFSLHAIILPVAAEPGMVHAFFGKGLQSEAAVRSRLLPEHEGAQVHLGSPIEKRADLAVRYLILLEQVWAEAPGTTGHWYKMRAGMPALFIAGAMRSSSGPPSFRSSAEGLSVFRQVAGVDLAVMAAMMGTERTRVHRLEQGKSKMSFEDYRRLRAWAKRLGLATEFGECFPIDPAREPIEHGLLIPDTPDPITEE